jgi:hypothetical protein
VTLTVDLHHHVIPEFYWQASNEDGNAAGGVTPPRWSLDGVIALEVHRCRHYGVQGFDLVRDRATIVS